MRCVPSAIPDEHSPILNHECRTYLADDHSPNHSIAVHVVDPSRGRIPGVHRAPYSSEPHSFELAINQGKSLDRGTLRPVFGRDEVIERIHVAVPQVQLKAMDARMGCRRLDLVAHPPPIADERLIEKNQHPRVTALQVTGGGNDILFSPISLVEVSDTR